MRKTLWSEYMRAALTAAAILALPAAVLRYAGSSAADRPRLGPASSGGLAHRQVNVNEHNADSIMSSSDPGLTEHRHPAADVGGTVAGRRVYGPARIQQMGVEEIPGQRDGRAARVFAPAGPLQRGS